MCKYCKDITDNVAEDMVRDREADLIKRSVNLGELGAYHLDVCMDRSKERDAGMYIMFGPENTGTILTRFIRMNYCPFCGRRLKKEDGNGKDNH